MKHAFGAKSPPQTVVPQTTTPRGLFPRLDPSGARTATEASKNLIEAIKNLTTEDTRYVHRTRTLEWAKAFVEKNSRVNNESPCALPGGDEEECTNILNGAEPRPLEEARLRLEAATDQHFKDALISLYMVLRQRGARKEVERRRGQFPGVKETFGAAAVGGLGGIVGGPPAMAAGAVMGGAAKLFEVVSEDDADHADRADKRRKALEASRRRRRLAAVVGAAHRAPMPPPGDSRGPAGQGVQRMPRV